MIKRIFLCICLLFAAQAFAMADTVLTENFNNIATLAGAGWALINQSAPLEPRGGFRGIPASLRRNPVLPTTTSPPSTSCGRRRQHQQLAPDSGSFYQQRRLDRLLYPLSRGVCGPVGVEA